jgi:hypothetical protein
MSSIRPEAQLVFLPFIPLLINIKRQNPDIKLMVQISFLFPHLGACLSN